MNIVSSVVGISIMGTAMPMVAQMSIQPYQAMKRAENFGIAESAAVTYVATNEWTASLDTTPTGCANPVKLASGAYSITCTEGEGTQYVQSVTRSFRLDDSCDDNDGNNGHGNSGGFDCSNPGKG